jgi:hypothetical protein
VDERSASRLINGLAGPVALPSKKNSTPSREYESWQQLEWFRPPFQIMSTKCN